MKRRYKILNGFLAILAVAIAALAFTLSYTADCPSAVAPLDGAETMQAVRYRCYGSTDVLEYTAVAKPVPGDDDVLVKVQAAAVNPLDWHYMRGSPYFMRLSSGIGTPEDARLGVDFAGTVVAVGKNVRDYAVGDEIFGGKSGAFAEYLMFSGTRAVQKPANISFAQAAAVPIAGLTALQALREHGHLQAGERVLINGASGGVGTFAVQIATAMGADVSGVCSTRNVDMVRSLGATRVFDYKKEDYTESGEKFDLIVDLVGNHSPAANRRVLAPEGRLILVGGPKGNWLEPLAGPLQAAVLSMFVDQKLTSILATMDSDGLAYIAGLMESGQVKAVIDRHYPLPAIAAALSYSEQGRARGKIIIDMPSERNTEVNNTE